MDDASYEKYVLKASRRDSIDSEQAVRRSSDDYGDALRSAGVYEDEGDDATTSPDALETYLRRIFDRVDSNGDGHIDREEAVTAVRCDEEFAAMLGFDSDESSTQLESAVAIMSSGLDRISWQEFRAAFLPPVDPFADYLRDYETYLRALFERADANSDGDLSYSELVDALNDPDFAEVAVDAMGFVDSGITREEFAQQFLEVCDWNEDYKVQWEEFREAALASALTAMHEGRMEAALRDVFDRVQGGDGTITIDDAVQGLRDDPDFAEVLGFFATHQANEFDGSLEYLIDKLVAMDTNQDGVIEWSEFRAVVFPPPPTEMDIYMQNYENYLRQVFERIDEDQSGSLSYGEIAEALRDDLKQAFDVDVVIGKKDAPKRNAFKACRSGDAPPFAAGDAVRVGGLVSKPQHNGRAGAVARWLPAKKRFEVTLEATDELPETSLALKAEHLSIVG